MGFLGIKIIENQKYIGGPIGIDRNVNHTFKSYFSLNTWRVARHAKIHLNPSFLTTLSLLWKIWICWNFERNLSIVFEHYIVTRQLILKCVKNALTRPLIHSREISARHSVLEHSGWWNCVSYPHLASIPSTPCLQKKKIFKKHKAICIKMESNKPKIVEFFRSFKSCKHSKVGRPHTHLL